MENKTSNFTHELRLPSKGLVNPELPEGKVVQRCMMVSDQKYLSGSNQSATSALQNLIQKTITSPADFDVSKLTSSDTLYLLFKLRSISYGDTYRFRTKCPECGKQIDITVDMSELDVKLLSDDYAEGLVAELPHRGDKVYTRIMTNKDTDEINKEVKRRKKRSELDDSEYILRIARSIDKIELATPDADGNTELTHSIDIEKYVSALTDLDAATIIAARDSADHGIVPTIEYTCPECREDIEVGINFSGAFFRPTPIK